MDFCQLDMNYVIVASFRLADLHPLFENLPMMKNPSQYLSLTLNTNMIHTISLDSSGALTAVSITNATNTCPYQLTEVGLNSATGLNVKNNLAGTISASISVGTCKNVHSDNAVSSDLKQCLFHACFVRLNTPSFDLYSSSVQPKPVFYEECYAQLISSIASGASVNQIISGTFSKLRKIVICPYITSTRGTINTLHPFQSPWCSEPSTCTAYVGNVAMTNFNVRVGTQNVFPSNIVYAYENYLQYFKSQNAINGGISNYLNNGLITQSDWENGYGFRVVDLSVQNQSNDLASKQITVTFKNDSTVTMDYIVLVYYEKNLLVNTERGTLESLA